jgi:hypothetical protein
MLNKGRKLWYCDWVVNSNKTFYIVLYMLNELTIKNFIKLNDMIFKGSNFPFRKNKTQI